MQLIPGKENPLTLSRDEVFAIAGRSDVRMDVTKLNDVPTDWRIELEDENDNDMLFVGETDTFIITIAFEEENDVIIGNVDVHVG